MLVGTRKLVCSLVLSAGAIAFLCGCDLIDAIIGIPIDEANQNTREWAQGDGQDHYPSFDETGNNVRNIDDGQVASGPGFGEEYGFGEGVTYEYPSASPSTPTGDVVMDTGSDETAPTTDEPACDLCHAGSDCEYTCLRVGAIDVLPAIAVPGEMVTVALSYDLLPGAVNIEHLYPAA